MKKSIVVILVFLLIGVSFLNSNIFGATFNYGEALQKSIYFYECQVSGPVPSWNRAKQWRGDSQMNCAITGGWLDAGDNVKFGLPMANSAAMLGWAFYEYGTAFTASGQAVHLKNNLKWACDYFVKCDKGTSMVYQIGDGGVDHSFWGPVEVTEKKKGIYPAFTCKASCVTGETAAALAIGYLVLGDSSYLTHAKSIFNLADVTRSDADYTAANGYYNSWSGFWDELCWAAIWLYLATNDSNYLAKAESYVPNFNKQGQSSDIEYQYGNSWDDVHYADLVLLARITNKPEYHRAIQNNLNWWTIGVNGARVTYTPGGLAWLQQWGPLRYAMNTSFLAFVYSDFITDATLKARYQNFAVRQVNYCLGDNPGNRSYVVGFGNNPPKRPHHRTAHGSWADSQTVPTYHRHTIYGALVGGPGANDDYVDDISNYTTNEIACDYNANFVGCLAKMYSLYGGTPLANFPVTDPVDDEFFIEASINSAGTNYTEIKALCNNRSGFPARFVKNLNFIYFMDLSEVIVAGASPSNITVSTNYVEIPVTVSPITQYSGNIYYVKISFNDGTSIYPGGQSEYAGEVQFRISAPTGTTYWNPVNDPSYKGLTSGSIAVKTPYIPVFDGTTLLYGNIPGNPTPTPVTVTPTSPPLTSTPTQPPVTVTVTPTPPPITVTPTPVLYLIPGKVEAENYSAMSGIQTETTSDTGGGLNVGWIDTGDWMEYWINVQTSGSYRIDFRVASINTTAKLDFRIGNVMFTNMSVPNTGGWQTWTTISAGLYLTAGPQIIRLYASGGGWNINWLWGKPVTASPTPIPTTGPTATPSPTPLSVTGNVKVQFYNQDRSTSVNQIYANFMIFNTGSTAINLANVKVRYYFTIDGIKPQNFYCDYCSAGNGNVIGTYTAITNVKSGADYYLEIGFTSGAGYLTPGSRVEVKTRAAKSDWSNYTQNNDYSFNATGITYADWTKVTGYLSGSLQWGVEP